MLDGILEQILHQFDGTMTPDNSTQGNHGYEVSSDLMLELANAVTRSAGSLNILISIVEQHITNSLTGIVALERDHNDATDEALLQIAVLARRVAKRMEELSDVVAAISARPPAT